MSDQRLGIFILRDEWSKRTINMWLKSYDPNAYNGRGESIFTDNPAEAITFENHHEAMTFYQQQSKVKPLRPDGKPNRPLTAYTAAIQSIDKKPVMAE